MRRPAIFAAIAAVAMMAANAASAAIVTVTIDGTVVEGFDNFHTFGGGSLTGDAFQAVFTFDTSVPAFSASNSQVTFINGGSSEPPSVSPSLGASITINGDTATIAGGYYSELWEGHGTSSLVEQIDTAYDDSVDVNGEDLSRITIDSYGFLPETIDQPIAKTMLLNGRDVASVGNVQILTENSGGLQNAFADLVATSLTETVAVPEPASWALMLCGFGALGGALRSRRKQAAVAA